MAESQTMATEASDHKEDSSDGGIVLMAELEELGKDCSSLGEPKKVTVPPASAHKEARAMA